MRDHGRPHLAEHYTVTRAYETIGVYMAPRADEGDKLMFEGTAKWTAHS